MLLCGWPLNLHFMTGQLKVFYEVYIFLLTNHVNFIFICTRSPPQFSSPRPAPSSPLRSLWGSKRRFTSATTGRDVRSSLFGRALRPETMASVAASTMPRAPPRGDGVFSLSIRRAARPRPSRTRVVLANSTNTDDADTRRTTRTLRALRAAPSLAEWKSSPINDNSPSALSQQQRKRQQRRRFESRQRQTQRGREGDGIGRRRGLFLAVAAVAASPLSSSRKFFSAIAETDADADDAHASPLVASSASSSADASSAGAL